MGDKSKIEWTDATWNPVTGCTRVSEGCRNCYIERTPPFRNANRRFMNREGQPSHEVGSTTGVTLHPDRLDQPLRWKKPRRVFVNSLSDLFHDQVPDDFILSVFAVMLLANRHVFQVLTKRPSRMASLLNRDGFFDEVQERAIAGVDEWGVSPQRAFDIRRRAGAWSPLAPWPLPNVWFGVSVEDQKAAELRIPKLLGTPAAVRFLSCEPLLGLVDLSPWLDLVWSRPIGDADLVNDERWRAFKGEPMRSLLDWIIVGGESGPGARPMHPDWARALRDQSAAAGVPFFFKQWGEWAPTVNVAHSGRVIWLDPDGRFRDASEALPAPGAQLMARVGKKAAGRTLDKRTWDEMPRA